MFRKAISFIYEILLFGDRVPLTNRGGVIIDVDVLDYLDQFKRKPVKGIGHSDPLRTPTPLG